MIFNFLSTENLSDSRHRHLKVEKFIISNHSFITLIDDISFNHELNISSMSMRPLTNIELTIDDYLAENPEKKIPKMSNEAC